MALNILQVIFGLSAIPPCFFMLIEKEHISSNGRLIDFIPQNSIFEVALALTGLAIVICGLLQLKARTAYAIFNILLGFVITVLSALITVQIIRTGYFDIPTLHIFGLMLLACSFGIISVALVQLKARFNDPAQESEQLPENAGL
ncbi:MAG: hypothetical protein PHF74_03580 [Dehalococcoidales bacterium]|nr:hypothetical protein [Dehalococcoidales bacterium]